MKEWLKRFLISIGLRTEPPITLFSGGTVEFWWEIRALEFVNTAATKIWAMRMGKFFPHSDPRADAIEMHKAEIEDWLTEEEEKFAYGYKGVRN